MRMSIRRHFLHLTGLVLSLLFGGLALAEDKADDKYAWSKSKVIDGRFMLGVGGVVTRFDTNYKITDKSSGVSIFIDGEGTLGLPTTNVSPGFYGLWRITEKHGIGFNYFSSDRDGETLGVDRNFGDLNVTGAVKIFDRSSFYYLNYNYMFADSQTTRVYGFVGLYGLDLELGIEAVGVITEGDEPPRQGFFRDEVNQFAPLPIVGLEFWQAVSPRWALGARFGLIGGRYQDITALVVDALIQSRYRMTENLGLLLGVKYFSGDIDIDEDDLRQEVSYGYDGFYVGLDFNW